MADQATTITMAWHRITAAVRRRRSDTSHGAVPGAGRIQSANPQAQRLLGGPEELLLGRDLNAFLPGVVVEPENTVWQESCLEDRIPVACAAAAMGDGQGRSHRASSLAGFWRRAGLGSGAAASTAPVAVYGCAGS